MLRVLPWQVFAEFFSLLQSKNRRFIKGSNAGSRTRAYNKKSLGKIMQNKLPNRFGKYRLFSIISGVLLMACGSAFAQPANDDCSSATVIPGTAPDPVYTDSVDATAATLDPADPLLSCNGPNDGNQTVWWEYTPDADGAVSFNTFGSTEAGGGELDTAHGVFYRKLWRPG